MGEVADRALTVVVDPTATITATDTMRPFWRTFTLVASIHRYGQSALIGRPDRAQTVGARQI